MKTLLIIEPVRWDRLGATSRKNCSAAAAQKPGLRLSNKPTDAEMAIVAGKPLFRRQLAERQKGLSG